MTKRAFIPPPTTNTLLLVLRSSAGQLAHVAIGSAFLDQNWDGAIWLLPAHAPDEASLASFFCDTPRQAREAMDELAELGDVDFRPADFERRWFDPAEGIAAVRILLDHPSPKARRLLTDTVRAELDLIRRTLQTASRLGSTFYLAEAYAHDSRDFAGREMRTGPENNQMQQTREPPSTK